MLLAGGMPARVPYAIGLDVLVFIVLERGSPCRCTRMTIPTPSSASEPVGYNNPQPVERVLELTPGGVDAAFDNAGGR